MAVNMWDCRVKNSLWDNDFSKNFKRKFKV